MLNLNKKLPKESLIKDTEVSQAIKTYKQAINCGIDSGMIYKMHYYDLQNLIVSIRIDNIKELMTKLRKEKLKRDGISNVVNASASDYDSL